MRFLFVSFAAAVVALSYGVAGAFPDGAPWGAAIPAAEQNCSSCHFDADPIVESAALRVRGLPQRPTPGKTYELEVVLDDPDTVVAGFQLIAQAADERAGTLHSSLTGVESIGAAARSTAPIANRAPAAWTIEWRTPDRFDADVVFYVAASAANDDGSPLGDTIHFRTYRLAAE